MDFVSRLDISSFSMPIYEIVTIQIATKPIAKIRYRLIYNILESLIIKLTSSLKISVYKVKLQTSSHHHAQRSHLICTFCTMPSSADIYN